MKCADLHIHSCYSDGLNTPEQLVALAKKRGVRYISITDHDSIAAQYITKNQDKEINIIPGIEFSTEYKDIELHLLGYFVDIDNNHLKEIVNILSKQRIKRVEKILFNLGKQNINLTFSDLAIDIDTTVGRSHIANAMVRKGYFDTYKNAFKSLLMKGKPAYVRGFRLHYRDTLDIIKESGGVSVLAHPGQIYRKIEIENIIRELKCFGLGGMEVYHPSHCRQDINNFFNLSKKYKLTITGGSDFHGREFLNEPCLGSCGLDIEMLERFIKSYK